MPVVCDMFGNSLKINDRVKFYIDHTEYEGMINLISPNGRIRVNSLIGEYRRDPRNVIKIFSGRGAEARSQ